ncbi:MAG: purine-nucleoside phosphorylase [Lysobacterales bacterium]|nr:purine-nucleoside phosphorylase [Xanthomonadales bacterium]MCB1611409.1 purine-nucleoside phosphorylase [Xanthomonadales bacterium]MCP5473631.1 purine-nucleoside phosphorylase [Rhodanobacteraceae bacterium]
MTTPHIEAPAGAFAETVLMPGDPLRARYIAERFLSDAEEVTAVRNMVGYTGTWRGQRLSVMGSGMGIPSCSIYASELIDHYGVKRIVRIGTCGATCADLALGDLVLALGASTDSNVNRTRFGGYDLAAIAAWPLARALVEAAERLNRPIRVGNVFSTDLFYSPQTDLMAMLTRAGILGIEMEAAGLYTAAAERGAQATALMTVSDHLITGARMSSDERQRGLDQMIEVALAAIG